MRKCDGSFFTWCTLLLIRLLLRADCEGEKDSFLASLVSFDIIVLFCFALSSEAFELFFFLKFVKIQAAV